MNKAGIEAYFTLGKRYGVPLELTVRLILDAKGYRNSGLIKQKVGVLRNALDKALAGEITPSDILIEKVSQELCGVNPWHYAPGGTDENQ